MKTHVMLNYMTLTKDPVCCGIRQVARFLDMSYPMVLEGNEKATKEDIGLTLKFYKKQGCDVSASSFETYKWFVSILPIMLNKDTATSKYIVSPEIVLLGALDVFWKERDLDNLHCTMYWGEDLRGLVKGKEIASYQNAYDDWKTILKEYGAKIVRLGRSRMADYPLFYAFFTPEVLKDSGEQIVSDLLKAVEEEYGLEICMTGKFNFRKINKAPEHF